MSQSLCVPIYSVSALIRSVKSYLQNKKSSRDNSYASKINLGLLLLKKGF